MRSNQTKAKLRAGETVFGCFVRYPDATLIEVIGYQGWDFIVFDGEHGTIEPQHCEHMVRAAEVRDVTPIIRVPTNAPSVILRYMDSGAQGLHVPWVNSGAEAEAVVRSVKYQPRGIRGLAGIRAADFGQRGTFGDYIKQANAETLVAIHIETVEAVEHLPEIIAIEGIDVIFIGPTDLSHSLGVAGEANHPTVQATMQRIVDLVAPSDKALGIMVTSMETARQWRERGARYITIGMESLLAPAMRGYIQAAKGAD